MSFFTREMVMLFGVFATIIIGLWNIKIAKHDNFIENVNSERVKWINAIRELFSEYNKTALLQHQRLVDLEREDKSSIEDLSHDIIHLNNHIELFLNPVETPSKKYMEIQHNITEMLVGTAELNNDLLAENLLDLHYLQQVTLKAEWKRVKEETRKGKEIKDKKTREIFTETAKKINSLRYEKLELNKTEQLNEMGENEGEWTEQKKYKYLHWIMMAYALLACFVLTNVLLSLFDINFLNALGSKQMETVITTSGFLLTMFGLIPFIKEKYKQKK
ncbi:hypothetical protein CN895_24100 [Bacillus cereus]|uniref:hypothetical protein n=1 Tax=Bacillus cereus TaxID=1396 RepID=UPI000BF426EC|nr:hypothetical protein [Bacillus cereus]PEY43144.1 hypothetical protein CN336_15095 [Bacillus cereus]PGK09696.1 hypothetical protein CN895_24100 [Bacillus cereus]